MNVSRNCSERRKLPARSCGLAAALAPLGAWPAEARPGFAEPLASAGLGQILLGLLLVVMIIFFITWILRRLPGIQTGGQGLIRVVDSLHVSPRDRLLLVEIDKQQLLLGVTTQNISTLHVLSEPVSRSAPRAEVASRLVRMFQQGSGGASS